MAPSMVPSCCQGVQFGVFEGVPAHERLPAVLLVLELEQRSLLGVPILIRSALGEARNVGLRVPEFGRDRIDAQLEVVPIGGQPIFVAPVVELVVRPCQ